MTLPYSTNFPKPGDTLTAAQANALPVGSVLRDSTGDEFERFEKGWGVAEAGYPWPGGEILLDGRTLVRVGPAPAEGTWEWAKAQMKAGKCVMAEGWQPKRIIDGVQHYWAYSKGPWVVEDGAVHDDRDWSRSTGWRIVPDPSAPAETPIVREELCEKVEALTAERDNYAAEQAVFAARVQQEKYRADMLAADLDRLRAENADLLATAHDLKVERDVAKREWNKAIDIGTRYGHDLGLMTAERDAALARAEAAEARLVVPQDVLDWAHGASWAQDNVARFILSLTADHLPDAKQMAPFTSTHPEGTREWAEDAMRAGFAVVWTDSPAYWQNFRCVSSCSDNGRKWDVMASDGWRIHTPAVAPEPLPSIAQIWARIAAIEERLGDVEAGV